VEEKKSVGGQTTEMEAWQYKKGSVVDKFLFYSKQNSKDTETVPPRKNAKKRTLREKGFEGELTRKDFKPRKKKNMENTTCLKKGLSSRQSQPE